MPARARAPVPRPRDGRGFTLAEILVVVLVIGLASAVLYPRLVPRPAAVLEREAVELARAMEMTASLAQWRSATLGVSIDTAGYRFWRRSDSGNWALMTGDDLRARTFDPPLVALAARIGGVPVPPGSVLPYRPSGRNDPVAVTLLAAEARAELRSDLLDRVSVSVSATPR
jgi:general secretion pathway protein H